MVIVMLCALRWCVILQKVNITIVEVDQIVYISIEIELTSVLGI